VSLALDTAATETLIIPDVLDDLGYSARQGEKITIVHSAIGAERGYTMRVAQFTALGFPVRLLRSASDALCKLANLGRFGDRSAIPVVRSRVDVLGEVAYATDVAVPAALLKQLLMLGERERVELAHALLESVNDNDELSDADRARLHAAIEQSISEIESGQTVPLDEALASLRAKRATRASR